MLPPPINKEFPDLSIKYEEDLKKKITTVLEPYKDLFTFLFI